MHGMKLCRKKSWRLRGLLAVCALAAICPVWAAAQEADKPAPPAPAPASQTAAAPAPASPQAAVASEDGIDYRFAYNGNVALIPMESDNGWLLVAVRVNNSKPALFLVATGAPHSVLDPAPWVPADSGPQTDVKFTNTLLSMPGIDFRVAHLLTGSLAEISAVVGKPVRGVLGSDILSKFVVELEYDRSSLQLIDAKTFEYTGKGVKIPLLVRSGVPSIRAKVSVPGQHTIEDSFEVLSEFGGTVTIGKTFVNAHHLRVAKIKGFGFPDGSGGKIVMMRGNKLGIGSLSLEKPIVEFPQGKGSFGSPPGGAIGNSIWKRFRMFLDYSRGLMILETTTLYPTDFDGDMSGVALRAGGANLKTFEVVGVAPRSPGSDSGLQKGDVIAGIDNQPAADLTLPDVEYMFRQLGQDYKLTILRGDKTFDAKPLKTRRLF